MRMKTILLAAAALSLAVPAAHAQNKPPIKVGAILPMSGFTATYGALFWTGMKMALDDVNAKGGVNGSMVEIQREDDQLAATQSVLLFRKLVESKAVVSLGPVSGTAWENIGPLSMQLKMPAINFTALKPGISVKPWALRIHPPDDTMIPEGVAEFVKKFPNAKRIVIAGDAKEASGLAGIEEFQKAAKANGLQVLELVEYQTRTTDFSPIVIKIRGLNPDAIFIASLAPTSLPFVKELETQGVKSPLLISALAWSGPFVNVIGSAGANLYTMGYATNTSSPAFPGYVDYAKRFLEITKDIPSIPKPANVANTVMAYEAFAFVADIMKRKGIDGNTDPVKARELIKDGMSEAKEFKDIVTFTIRGTYDGHIKSHLLKADVANKVWVFGLEEKDRIK